jgi:hypothetical protein
MTIKELIERLSLLSLLPNPGAEVLVQVPEPNDLKHQMTTPSKM